MQKTIRTAVLAGACFVLGLGAPALLAQAKEPAAKPAAAGLHRMDFRVEGASCVACLRRTAQELRETKGVIKADVSIYRPYWAIVIYDSGKTNLERMKESIKNEHIKLADVEDKPIASVPAIIVPKSIGEQPAQAQ